MHIIAVVNQKGGCGKTTTAINLSAALGRQDARVLLIDMDPQGHAAMGLGVAAADQAGLYELLKGDCHLDEVIRSGVALGVDLIPGDISLAAAEHLLAEQPDRDRQLARHLARLAVPYDYVVLDCPPALGLLSVNALRAADRVVIPVEPSLYSLDGIERLRETIHLLTERDGVRPSIHLLANMFDSRTRIAREMLEMLESQIPVGLFATRIRSSVRVREAACQGAPLTEHAPRAPVTGDFLKLAEELRQTSLPQARSKAAPARRGTAAADENDALRHLTARSEAGTAGEGEGMPAAFAETGTPTADEGDAHRTPSARPEAAAAIESEGIPTSSDREETAYAEASDAVPSGPAHPDAPAAEEPAGAADGLREVVFRFDYTGNKQVQIAGEFNNWVPDQHVETEIQDGSLQKILRVSPGGYEYRLIIDGVWQEDPANPEAVPNHLGGYNSLLNV